MSVTSLVDELRQVLVAGRDDDVESRPWRPCRRSCRSRRRPRCRAPSAPASRAAARPRWIGSICCARSRGIAVRVALYSGYQSSRKVLPLSSNTQAPCTRRILLAQQLHHRDDAADRAGGKAAPARAGRAARGRPGRGSSSRRPAAGSCRSSSHCARAAFAGGLRGGAPRRGPRIVGMKLRRRRSSGCLALRVRRPIGRSAGAVRDRRYAPARARRAPSTAAAPPTAPPAAPRRTRARAGGEPERAPHRHRGRRAPASRNCACAAQLEQITVSPKGAAAGLRDHHRRRRRATSPTASARRAAPPASASGTCSGSEPAQPAAAPIDGGLHARSRSTKPPR